MGSLLGTRPSMSVTIQCRQTHIKNNIKRINLFLFERPPGVRIYNYMYSRLVGLGRILFQATPWTVLAGGGSVLARELGWRFIINICQRNYYRVRAA